MAGRRGFGGVRKLPSGRYQAYYGVPGSWRERVNAPTTFATKKAADVWLAEQQVLIERRQIGPEAHVIAFEDYARRWLRQRSLKIRTRADYANKIEHVLIPGWGTTALADIEPVAVRAWHSTLAPDAPTQRARIYALFRTILTTAVEDGLLADNPCRVRGAGQSPKPKHAIVIAAPSELATIEREMPTDFRLMVTLAAWCSLRFAEIDALRRKDVQLWGDVVDGRLVRRCKILVVRNANWDHGKVYFESPKTDAVTREVAVPPHVIPAVEEHLERIGTRPDALLFARPDGLPTSRESLRNLYEKARVAAGRPDLRFYDLRHTGNTHAAVAGATPKELMERAGHTTAAMAMRYQHAAEGRDIALAERMSGLAL